MRLRLGDRDEPAVIARLPERRLVVVDDQRGDTRHPPGAARVDVGEAVLALKLGDRFRRRHGSVRRERAHRQRELLRPLRLPGEVRLAHRGPDERVVAWGDRCSACRVAVALTIAYC